jgi:uncharacterized DUF497 family protein
MEITFDPAKRERTLLERGLDFCASSTVFAGQVYEQQDDRFDYGEVRILTVGYLNGRMVIIIWTPRGEARHIISMRKANEREQKYYTPLLQH